MGEEGSRRKDPGKYLFVFDIVFLMILMCLLTLLDVGIYRGTEEEEGILFFFSLIF